MSTGPSVFDHSMSSKAVLDELQAVCESLTFARAGEARRLLRYLVETEQAGRVDDLREVQIGAQLYGRAPSYDPKIDGIVRVNAARLRVRLEEHYAANPGNIRILLPVGSYVPFYEQAATIKQGPGILIAPLPHSNLPTDAAITLPAVPVKVSSGSLLLWVAAAAVITTVMLIPWTLNRMSSRERGVGPTWIAHPFSRLGGAEHFPAFSPDGHSIVFAWTRPPRTEPVLYIQDVMSDLPRPVTGLDRAENRPAWSPNGSELAFVQPDGTGSKRVIVRIMPAGVETTIATLPGSKPWLCGIPKLSWAPDGRTIYTAAALPRVSPLEGPAERCGIVAITLADQAVRILTRSPAGSLGDLEPSVSPDGQTVAFMRSVSYGVEDVYTVDAEGGATKRLTFDNREIQGMQWMPGSRNGAIVLAARAGDGVLRLSELNLVTGQVTLLTDGSAGASYPAIARDGRHIAFTSYRSSTSIYRVSSTVETSINSDDTYKSAPRLSPDGRRLVFASDRSGYGEIWISDADGSNAVRLTHSLGTGAHDPSWFPDGRSILYECRDRQHSQICTTAADGQGPVKRVTPESEDADHVLPTLSRNGQFVYYLSNRSGRQEAYRQALAGGEPRQISNGGAAGVVESWDGKSIFLESLKEGVGFLLVPVAHEAVETGTLTDANRAYHLPSLKRLQGGPSVPAPGGLIFYLDNLRPAALRYFDQTTHIERVFAPVSSDPPDLLSVAPDGRSVLYSTRGSLTGEIDLLTKTPSETMLTVLQ